MNHTLKQNRTGTAVTRQPSASFQRDSNVHMRIISKDDHDMMTEKMHKKKTQLTIQGPYNSREHVTTGACYIFPLTFSISDSISSLCSVRWEFSYGYYFLIGCSIPTIYDRPSGRICAVYNTLGTDSTRLGDSHVER